MDNILRVEDLRVELRNGLPVVEDVSLVVKKGDILAIVGESGSGKTTTALAFLGYARAGTRIARGEVVVAGRPILRAPPGEQRRIRGRLVAYVPQDPATSLNPAMRVGEQIATVLAEHFPDRDAARAVGPALARLGLPADHDFQRRYPHQLSGGQQQRVAIAMALVCEPPLVVFDEPTTALDVVTQALILDEIARLRQELGIGMVYVSHNLAVVATIADRIAVMYAGRVVEEAPTANLLARPRHPYTRGLLASVPDHVSPRRLHGIAGTAPGPGERPQGCPFAPRCPQRIARCGHEMPALEPVGPSPGGHQVRCFEWRHTPALSAEPADDLRPSRDGRGLLLAVEKLSAVHQARHGPVAAVRDVSFTIGTAECVALVGESGSGKTTIARCVIGLHRPHSGRILLEGTALAPSAQQRTRDQRRRVHMVFQNPYDSLNPRHRVGDAVARSAQILRELSKRQAEEEARRLLGLVRLPAASFARYPAELSGGERQRVAIARALAAQPDVLICDEITSALDVSVQAAVIELLEHLRHELHLALLLISHDLALVASVADRVIVLEKGVAREEGPVRQVLLHPADGYTSQLIAAAPRLPAPALAHHARARRAETVRVPDQE